MFLSDDEDEFDDGNYEEEATMSRNIYQQRGMGDPVRKGIFPKNFARLLHLSSSQCQKILSSLF